MSFKTTDFFNAIYKLVIPDDTVINFDPVELERVRWLTVSEVDSLMSSNPEKFTPAFLEAWAQLREKLITK